MAEPRDPLLIPILSACNFTIGMGAFVLVGLLNPISNAFGISASAAGAVMTTYAIAYALLSPLLVSITGRFGRRRVLAVGLAIFALGNLASALADTPLLLHLSRVLAAAGAGMFTPVAAAVAAGLAAPDRQGRDLAAVFFGLTLAQVLGVPAGSFVAYTFGWRAAFAIVVVLALPCLWLIWTRVPAGLSFRSVALSDLRRSLGDGRIMLAVLFTTSFLGGIYVVYTYLAPLLSQTMGFERDGISLSLLIFGVGAVAGNLLGGILTDRLGPFRALTGLAACQILIMPVFSGLPLPQAALALLLFVWSVCGWSFMAAQQVRLIALAPQTIPVVLALNAAAIYVGAAAGSALGGAALDLGGIHALGIAGGATACLALAHILVSRRLSGQ